MVRGREVDLKQLAKCVEIAQAHLANLWREIDIAARYEGVPGWEPDIDHYEAHLISAKYSVGRAINIIRGEHGNEQEEDHASV